jgi:hypothetical protein
LTFKIVDPFLENPILKLPCVFPRFRPAVSRILHHSFSQASVISIRLTMIPVNTIPQTEWSGWSQIFCNGELSSY